jgi:hypothetical protein
MSANQAGAYSLRIGVTKPGRGGGVTVGTTGGVGEDELLADDDVEACRASPSAAGGTE